jgi:16S rRNA (adenine1518-N6/adenine1519-N6)-dimethyltransferase
LIDVRKAIRDGEVKPNQRLGQCFLADAGVAGRIAQAAELTPGDHAIEVGPGVCALTGLLCERAGSVVSVELDRSLVGIVRDAMSGYDNFLLINADIRKIKADRLLPSGGGDSERRAVFISNMPYYISTQIMTRLFEEFAFVDRAVLMMQSEVADKILAGPSDPDYNMLTVFANSAYAPKLLFHVAPHCFAPQPGVESAVVAFAARESPLFEEARDRKTFFRLVRAAFAARRKTLGNCMIAAGLVSGRGQAEEALAAAKIKSGARGETLGADEFAALAKVLATLSRNK